MLRQRASDSKTQSVQVKSPESSWANGPLSEEPGVETKRFQPLGSGSSLKQKPSAYGSRNKESSFAAPGRERQRVREK